MTAADYAHGRTFMRKLHTLVAATALCMFGSSGVAAAQGAPAQGAAEAGAPMRFLSRAWVTATAGIWEGWPAPTGTVRCYCSKRRGAARRYRQRNRAYRSEHYDTGVADREGADGQRPR